MRNYILKHPGALLHTLSKLYDVPVGFVHHPYDILRLCIALLTVAGGWLFLDIGWFVLFLSSFLEFSSAVKFWQNPFSGFRGEVENQIRTAILFFDPKTHKPGRWCCFLSRFVEFRSAVLEKSKISQPIRGKAAILFPIGSKNTNLVKDIEILLPVKFR